MTNLIREAATAADHELSFDDWDEATSPGPDVCGFDIVADKAMSRRGFLGALTVFGATSFLMGTSALTPAQAASRLSFRQVAANTEDTITVPEGYSWDLVIRSGPRALLLTMRHAVPPRARSLLSATITTAWRCSSMATGTCSP